MLEVLTAFVAGYVFASFILLRRPHLLHSRKTFPFVAQHISHRGGAGENIENTKKAFLFAVQSNTQMLELDCRLTKDNQVVVFHDCDLQRCTGHSGPISDFDYSSLPHYLNRLNVFLEPGQDFEPSDPSPSPIIPLREVFEAFPDVAINIDIKVNDDRLITGVSRLINEFSRHRLTVWGGMRKVIVDKCKIANPTVLTYPSPEYVLGFLFAYYVGLLPFLPISFDCFELPLVSVLRKKGFLKQHNCDTPTARVLARVFEFLITSPGFIQHLKRRGIPVFIWVCNTDSEFKTAFDMGASGVMTDFPTRLQTFLNANPEFTQQ
ncbi:Glycerophosphodiester phosphodiesterase domain-containing protein 1 [Paragonimus heterotremus]|uniref:Glycerophosphodiester phosphodiesterase domain-containing protein 1 n=1 Tax=Paragonimus heterotremus TaxID=100268 RepID=A0A8J4TIF1_9TREM|nr:Glycerophosphodiester phosphodiesterase domain-containing protein 1 [Paragonimus heterotremus]